MHAYALVVLESVLVLTSAEKIIQAFETDPSSWWQLYQSFSFIALYFEHVHKSEFSYVFNPSHCQPTPRLFLSLELQCSLSLLAGASKSLLVLLSCHMVRNSL